MYVYTWQCLHCFKSNQVTLWTKADLGMLELFVGRSNKRYKSKMADGRQIKNKENLLGVLECTSERLHWYCCPFRVQISNNTHFGGEKGVFKPNDQNIQTFVLLKLQYILIPTTFCQVIKTTNDSAWVVLKCSLQSNNLEFTEWTWRSVATANFLRWDFFS